MASTAELPVAARFGQGPPLILLALLLTCAAPLWLLLLAPLLLGVPHLLADLRYLVLQRPGGMTRTLALAILAPLAAMTLLRLGALAGSGAWPRLEIACGMAAILVGAVGGARQSHARGAFALALVGLALLACADPAITQLLLAHAHNVVALLWFLAWCQSRQVARATLLIYVVAALTLGLGLLPARIQPTAGTFTWSSLTDSLGPGLDAPWADRLVLSYAFAQTVHYALWLWLIPGQRRQSGRGLRADLGGTPGLVLAAGACVLVPALALRDPTAVRSTYLSLALFHGWLELAVAAFLGAGRSR